MLFPAARHLFYEEFAPSATVLLLLGAFALGLLTIYLLGKWF